MAPLIEQLSGNTYLPHYTKKEDFATSRSTIKRVCFNVRHFFSKKQKQENYVYNRDRSQSRLPYKERIPLYGLA
jgi:hypothetical protein